MAQAKCSEDEFIALFRQHGAAGTAKVLGISQRNVHTRRRAIEGRRSLTLSTPKINAPTEYTKRLNIAIDNGVMVIASDAHYWPGEKTTAHRGLVYVTKKLQPTAIVMNGDILDFPRISRHDRIGWSQTPTVKEELEVVDDRLHELRKASPKSECYWNIGNHDARFENKLSNNAPEFEGVHGFQLKDQFPDWIFSMSIWVNDDVVIKHRFKGGVHATHNNTVAAGKTMVTGHLHSLKVTPYNDYNGTRFGIDTGTLSDPNGDHADYGEDNPLNHRSGFIVLTFIDGRLLWPEVCRVIDADTVEFRGKLIKV